MSAFNAALTVLKEAGKPLTVEEITQRILAQKLWQTTGKTPAATVGAQLYENIKENGDASPFVKVRRGVFGLREWGGKEPTPVQTGVTPTARKAGIREEDFYEPFAEYLKKDLNEVTEAVALGGSGREKWGTPDVLGVYRSKLGDPVPFTLEIISAELKLDSQSPVTAFGQAVAYRLFSTKTYVAMPHGMSEEVEKRLEALCMLFGVGLVLFKPDPKKPDFSIRVRAQRFIPDMAYANEFAEDLKKHRRNLFAKLFP